MAKKYDAIYKICEWSGRHHKKEFFYYEVNVHPRTLASLCDSPYRDRTWVKRCGKSEKRDATHGLMKYSLAIGIDLVV
jgi:hypothetical protein